MSCPNGHKGGVFCCEDHVNQCYAEFYEKYKNWDQRTHPLIPCTLEHLQALEKLWKEQEDELQPEAG